MSRHRIEKSSFYGFARQNELTREQGVAMVKIVRCNFSGDRAPFADALEPAHVERLVELGYVEQTPAGLVTTMTGRTVGDDLICGESSDKSRAFRALERECVFIRWADEEGVAA